MKERDRLKVRWGQLEAEGQGWGVAAVVVVVVAALIVLGWMGGGL